MVLQRLQGRVQEEQSDFANLEAKTRDTSHKKDTGCFIEMEVRYDCITLMCTYAVLQN